MAVPCHDMSHATASSAPVGQAHCVLQGQGCCLKTPFPTLAVPRSIGSSVTLKPTSSPATAPRAGNDSNKPVPHRIPACFYFIDV